MKRKLWLSTGMLAVGTGLLVAAGFASAAGSSLSTSATATQKKGGTFRASKSTDFDYVDPALAYFQDSWNIEWATTAAFGETRS